MWVLQAQFESSEPAVESAAGRNSCLSSMLREVARSIAGIARELGEQAASRLAVREPSIGSRFRANSLARRGQRFRPAPAKQRGQSRQELVPLLSQLLWSQ